ncbi:hypothetical protein QBC39DRAFT_349327 [Podospora conica]|nr:hypothetical protein QBC39DRAFT_349327 [Schizothecium conicum]
MRCFFLSLCYVCFWQALRCVACSASFVPPLDRSLGFTVDISKKPLPYCLSGILLAPHSLWVWVGGGRWWGRGRMEDEVHGCIHAFGVRDIWRGGVFVQTRGGKRQMEAGRWTTSKLNCRHLRVVGLGRSRLCCWGGLEPRKGLLRTWIQDGPGRDGVSKIDGARGEERRIWLDLGETVVGLGNHRAKETLGLLDCGIGSSWAGDWSSSLGGQEGTWETDDGVRETRLTIR